MSERTYHSLAANASGIPSILITNFTFDSVYSYLATPLLQVDLEASSQPDHLTPATNKDNFTALVPDIPVSSAEIDPLVAQIHEGYRCADLLLLLPGCIPIPSFPIYPSLPAPNWVNAHSNSFYSDIIESLSRIPSPCALHPSFPLQSSFSLRENSARSVVAAPLLVRPHSTTLSPYTPEGRAHLLSTVGVPPELHDPGRTRVLIVSFGGQVFRAPSRTSSRQSPCTSPGPSTPTRPPSSPSPLPISYGSASYRDIPGSPSISVPPRLATPSHIWIPGAPPAHKPHASPTFNIPELSTIPPTPHALQTVFDLTPPPPQLQEEVEARLLPDESWIAIVCGVSKDKWGEDDNNVGLPDGFYVAPRDVYMPDLTAIGDVLLGKLVSLQPFHHGIFLISSARATGLCRNASMHVHLSSMVSSHSNMSSSSVDLFAVSRPLFIEEHGLRLLLDKEGVGIELSRQSYEAGDWALAVEEAWARGNEAKALKRSVGIGMNAKRKEGLKMAHGVVEWTQDWWKGVGVSN
ncbi:hypothetical protein C0991_009987 [Blastosporella zonata]|nr:hypothetical protein C0991_009987 [Blastosporella zonata]